MFEQFSDVLTVKDIAIMLHIGRNSAYELIKTHQIPSVRVKSQIRISKESVISYPRGADQPFLPLHSCESYQASARIS